MNNDIELLREIKERLTQEMVRESTNFIINGSNVTTLGSYIGAISNAIELMKATEESTEG